MFRWWRVSVKFARELLEFSCEKYPFPALYQLTSGNLLHNYGKIHHVSWVNHGKSSISMAMFKSKLLVYQRLIPMNFPQHVLVEVPRFKSVHWSHPRGNPGRKWSALIGWRGCDAWPFPGGWWSFPEKWFVTEGHWIKVKPSNYTLRIQRCSIYMFGESWSNSACLRPSWCIALLRRDRAPWWPAGSSPVLAGIIMKRTAGPVLTMHVQTFMIYDMVQIAKNEGFE